MQQFSFPILDRKEILSYVLVDAGIALEEQHLVKPTCEVLWPVYENLALNITGKSREELHQPAFHEIEKLEYPELHEDSFGMIDSICAIRKVMAATSVADFTTSDIYKPESKRTIVNLSAIINLLKFKQGRERNLEDIWEERERLCTLYQQLEERRAALNAEVEAIEADRLAQQPAVQVLETELKELNQEIKVLNKQHGALNADIRALKQEGQAVADEINAEKFSLIQLKDEQARLQGQIVQSPQKLQRSLAEKRTALANSKASAEEAQALLKSWKDRIEAYNKVEKKLNKISGMQDEVEKRWVTQKATIKELKALRAQLKFKLKEEVESMETELSQQKFQEQHLLDLTEKLEQQGPEKLQEAKRELSESKGNCLPLLARIDERGAAILKAEEQVKELSEKMKSMHKKRDNTISRGQAAVQKITKETLQHFRTVLELGPAELGTVGNVPSEVRDEHNRSI